MSRKEHQLGCDADLDMNVWGAPIEVRRNIKQMTREEFNKVLKSYDKYAYVPAPLSISASPNKYIESEESFIIATWDRWLNPQEILSFFEEMHSKLWDVCVKRWYCSNYMLRTQFVQEYGWAIISPSAILEMAEFIGTADCLSVGCGSAYIEYLLRLAGVKIAVTDNGSETCGKQYIKPFICEGRHASKYFPTCKVLFLSWSRIDAAKYGDYDKIIYIGEEGGCTAGYPDPSKWVQVDTIGNPCWYGINDFIGLFVRKYPRRPKRPMHKDITTNFSFAMNVCETKKSSEKSPSTKVNTQFTYYDFPELRTRRWNKPQLSNPSCLPKQKKEKRQLIRETREDD